MIYKQQNHFFLRGCSHTIFLGGAMLTQESTGFGARESEVATCILTHLYLSAPELLTPKKLWDMLTLNFISNIQAKVVNKNCCSHSKIISLPSSLQVVWWKQNPVLFFKGNYGKKPNTIKSCFHCYSVWRLLSQRCFSFLNFPMQNVYYCCVY